MAGGRGAWCAAMFALRQVLPLGATLVVLLASVGCKGPCLELSERLCECEPTRSQRDTCRSVAAGENSRVDPTVEEADRCEQLLDVCDCQLLSTRDGKEQCGLARPSQVRD